MTRTGTYRYARVTEISRWLAAGWIDCGPCPGHHGYWSHLMRACECNPEGLRVQPGGPEAVKPVRLAALRVACPKCGSGPMVACNGKKGKRKAVHRDRIAVSCAAVSPKLVAARPDAGGFYQSPAWRRLRYEAIKLHGGRCQCCGATARAGTSLHVDHIKPRSRHPDLELSLSNLQVLCEDCNLGKGAHDQTDWRRA